jgi:16S rRNA (cytosine967-C5)-methyltransferase
MDPESLYARQVNTVLQVFETVHQRFLDRKPVDRALPGIFRKAGKYGSKDRKRISAAIFGYYRWRGWIDELVSKNRQQALLLGYLFDGNPVDETTRYWARCCGLHDHWLEIRDCRTINDQLDWNRQWMTTLGHCPTIKELVPACAAGWPDALITAMQSRPGLWIRSEADRQPEVLAALDRQNIEYRVFQPCPTAIEILTPINLNEFAVYRQGYLEVQDIAAQAVGLACIPEPDCRWWDVCAGSGGKALHLSSLMAGSGTVVATETDQWKFQELKRRTRRLGHRHNIVPTAWDGKAPSITADGFDGILIDAPCSCSGTWRRAPDRRWSTTSETIAQFREIQIQLLLSCCQYLENGGVLVYATCSLFPEENEQVISHFLAKRPDFRQESMTCPFGGGEFENGLYLLPPQIDGNGMYIARLRKG